MDSTLSVSERPNCGTPYLNISEVNLTAISSAVWSTHGTERVANAHAAWTIVSCSPVYIVYYALLFKC